MLTIAIQRSGRLYESSIGLLKECGIELSNGNRELRTLADNFPLQIYFLRDDDIPQYIQDSVADIGIVGENILLEQNKDLAIVEKLGFGKCRLSLAVPKEFNYSSVRDLGNKKIATTYPHLLEKFLDENKVNAEIHEISGSVEIAPGIGLADAVCDLVSSGSTLFMNGLKETDIILRSEAVLISGKKMSDTKAAILERLLLRIRAVKAARHSKYIMLNAPNEKLSEISRLLPGSKSPTIVSLALRGWSSVQAVVNEDDFWELIEKLKALGAEGILVVPIEKMIL